MISLHSDNVRLVLSSFVFFFLNFTVALLEERFRHIAPSSLLFFSLQLPMKRHKSGGGEEEEEGERHTQRDVNTAHSSSPTRLAQYFSSSLVVRSVTLEMIELVQVGSEPIGICLSHLVLRSNEVLHTTEKICKLFPFRVDLQWFSLSLSVSCAYRKISSIGLVCVIDAHQTDK